ncbi:MAG: hypothetical protein JNJ45_00165 [Chthonomonas sp.]|nr:hypothetical protein [Chthonomonas sp.]
MRSLLICVGVVASGVAHASFELVLALDSSGRVIHRLDGDTNTYLGSFGRTRLVSPVAMALHQSSNRVYVHDTSIQSLMAFDYNTGEQVAEIPVATNSFSTMAIMNNGNILFGDFYSSTIRQYTNTGTLVNTFTAPGGAGGVRAMGQAPDGNIFAVYNGTNAVTRYTSGGSLVGNVATGVTTISDSRQMVFQGNQVVLSGGNTGNWVRFNYSAGSWTSATPISTGQTYAYGAAGGHFSSIYAGGYTASVGYINAYARTSGALRSTFTLPGNATIISLACVVAPEPSGLAFIGIATVLLLRRKSR